MFPSISSCSMCTKTLETAASSTESRSEASYSMGYLPPTTVTAEDTSIPDLYPYSQPSPSHCYPQPLPNPSPYPLPLLPLSLLLDELAACCSLSPNLPPSSCLL